MQTFNETMLKAVRASNPKRVVYVTSRGMDIETLNEVLDGETIAADWNVALAFEDVDGKVFAGDSDGLKRFTDAARTFAWGREIYLAEFKACGSDNDPAVRDYLRTVRDAAAQHGWSWAVYDYQSGCAVRTQNGTGGPARAIRELNLKADERH